MHKNMVIFGTRPEAIKLFPVIDAVTRYSDMRTEVLVSAQHRQMLDQVLAISGIMPDYDLDLMQPGQSLDTLTARLLEAIGSVLDTAKPDRVIVQGDTATAMVGALAAYYRKIPVSHVEAGLRSRDIMNLTGANITVIDQCSGTDGMWGLKAGNEKFSVPIAKKLANKLEAVNNQIVAGDCHLANTAIVEQTGIVPQHPLQVVARAYGIAEEPPTDLRP